MPSSLEQKKVVIAGGSELALYGRYVISKRLAEEGFEFQLPQLREALCFTFGHSATKAATKAVGNRGAERTSGVP